MICVHVKLVHATGARCKFGCLSAVVVAITAVDVGCLVHNEVVVVVRSVRVLTGSE